MYGKSNNNSKPIQSRKYGGTFNNLQVRKTLCKHTTQRRSEAFFFFSYFVDVVFVCIFLDWFGSYLTLNIFIWKCCCVQWAHCNRKKTKKCLCSSSEKKKTFQKSNTIHEEVSEQLEAMVAAFSPKHSLWGPILLLTRFICV